MDKKELIVIGGVGGGLALILWLAKRNKNVADVPTMPYGWGSFQSGDNKLTPIYTEPTPVPLPVQPGEQMGFEPWFSEPWKGDYVKWYFDKYGTYPPEAPWFGNPPKPPEGDFPIPVLPPWSRSDYPTAQDITLEPFKPLTHEAVRNSVQPVLGKETI